MTTEMLVQLAMAFPASLGFALMFNLRPKLLLPASLGGLLTWAVYLACTMAFSGVFLPCLVASAFAAVYSQALASWNRAPIAIFYIISEIPLIPGRGLYYTMSYTVQGDWAQAQAYGAMTIAYVLAIAFGIALAWAGREMLRRYHAAHHES